MSSTPDKETADPLGKVFLSHASPDKKFVRGLATRLQKAGVQVWLDERELIVGDSLPEEIFAAIEGASAVIIVVSENSLRSDWVRNELRAASMRMVKGECRLIPIVLDDSEPPAEMTGLFYADCRPNRKGGMKKILRALEVEARAQEDLQRKRDEQKRERARPTVNHADTMLRGRGIDFVVEQVFGKRGFASMDVSATRALNWEEVSIKSGKAEEVDIAYDVVHAYSKHDGDFKADDYEDWTRSVTEDYDLRYGLIVSERPISPQLVPRLEIVTPHVFIQRIPKAWQRSSGALCLVNLEPQLTDEEALQRITDAHRALSKAIGEQVDPEPLPPRI